MVNMAYEHFIYRIRFLVGCGRSYKTDMGDRMSEAEHGNRDGPDDWAPDPDPDSMSDGDWAARLAAREDEAEPDDPDAEENLDSGVPAQYAGVPMAELIAEAREVSAAEARAIALARAGLLGSIGAERRGPGYSGPLQPGEYADPTGALAEGGALDTALPSGTLALFLEDAAGGDGLYRGASDDEVMGAVVAWDRMRSYVTARLYEATAALIRHRPAPGREANAPGELPGVWEEFTATEVAHTLADSRYNAEALVETAYDLAGKLTGTMRALFTGDVRDDKARIIQRATANLDAAEARAVEEMVLGRAGRITPGSLRAAVNRAVMEVAPQKARERREAAAKTRQVEMRAEESGNAQIAARELDADVAEAIDAELTERARELKKAGVGTGTGDRRVLAFLERFGLAGDLPPSPRVIQTGSGPAGTAQSGTGPTGTGPTGTGGQAGTAVTVPGRLNLTVPLATLAGEADRPGELSGFGPVDPWLARRLGEAALRSSASKVCVTLTGQAGMMVGHGCARPPTRAEQEVLRKHARARPPGPSLIPMPGQDAKQLQSGRGTWILDPGNGRDAMIIRIWPVSTDPCDHRLLTAAHNPGKELRHLTDLRYGACSGPVCRRPARQSDWEHNKPWEEHGATCLCNGNPKCRFEHRLKQDARWRVTQHPDGTIDWTGPTGRTATKEPQRFPV
jgi:Domain of unknown function (DUF222)